jgi:tetratricopeptide (TPR) repeat protein
MLKRIHSLLIVFVVVGALVGSLTYVHYGKVTKSEAQTELTAAETTLAEAEDSLNPAPLSMQDLTEFLGGGEEDLIKARTSFDRGEYGEALNLAKKAREVAEETITRAKRRVEGNIQTVEEKIEGIENLDNPPHAATLLSGKAQDLLDNAKKEHENKEYGLAQEFVEVAKATADNAVINIGKVENAEIKIERIEELKRTFEQELGEFIAATLEEARKQLENAMELQDVCLSNGFAENAKKVSENVLQKMSELALEEINEAEEAINLVENMMDTSNCYPHAVTVLVGKAKEILSNAREAYEEEKYGQALGQAHAAKMLARNALRILEEELDAIAEQENYLKTAVVEVVAGSPVDVTPPTIHRVWVEPDIVTIGDPVTIYIDVTDDLSGVSGVSAHFMDGLGRIQGGTMVWNRTPEGFWYETVNYVRKYTAAGIWTVDVFASDDVYNSVSAYNVVQFVVVPSEIVVDVRLIDVPQEVESGENFSVLINMKNTTNISLENIVIYSYLGDLTLGIDEVNLEPYENQILVHSAVLSDVKPGKYAFGITAMYKGRVSGDERLISVKQRI